MANSLLILEAFSFTLESLKYAEAELNYQESLSTGALSLNSKPSPSLSASSQHALNNTPLPNSNLNNNETSSKGLSLAQQVAQARAQITLSLSSSSLTPGGVSNSAESQEEIAMREENQLLRKKVENLEEQLKKLTERVSKLETSGPKVVKSGGDAPAPAKAATPAKKDDDDDVDLFGSDEEDDAEAAKLKEKRLAEYAAKKSKKPALVAKSNVILDIKPWDDETDMKVLEEQVRTIQMDGLLWGASKLVPLAYGIKKLQIATVVEDDKVSIEELTEKIEAFEDVVQSVDIAAFNKI